MSWLGVDIGGANLKIADGRGFAASRPFALWRAPNDLAKQLRALIALGPRADRLAITMTGELADCFATKAEGVRTILQAVIDVGQGCVSRVYLTDGRLVSAQTALGHTDLAAASNWHVLARYAGRFVPRGTGLLVDIGSTTTDLIPLVDQAPAVNKADDTTRLIHGQLVYTGVERSPVCAVAETAMYRQSRCPLVPEWFATMRDVYLTLGDLPEDSTDTNTADGRAATKEAARGRLAHAICSDSDAFDQHDAHTLAQSLASSQVQRIVTSMKQVTDKLSVAARTFVVCGQGEFLAHRAVQQFATGGTVISLAERLGPVVSRCAPAHALATIARESHGS